MAGFLASLPAVAGAVGAVGSLFGGGGGSTTNTTLKRVDLLTPEQQAALKELMGVFGSGYGPANASPNAFLPATEQEQQYYGFINSLSKNDALNAMISGKPAYDVNADWANNYYEQSVKPTMMKEFNDVTLPGIEAAFSGPTYWGTGRQNALVKASTDMGTSLASEKAKLLYDTELARRTALSEAANRVPGAISLKTAALGDAGNLSRTIGQEEIAAKLGKFLMGEEVDGSYNPAYNPAVSIAMNLLGIQSYGYGTETNTKPQKNIFQRLIS